MITTHENKKPWPVLMHLAGWGMLFGLPLAFAGQNWAELTFINYLRGITIPLSFMCVFYINYFFLVKHFLFAKNTGRFFLANAVLIIAMIVMVHFLMQWMPDPNREHHQWEPELQFRIFIFFMNVMFYSLVAGFSVAIKMTAGWFEVERVRKEVETARTEAELKNLKSQLNPHFLFNTLNNIYSLIAFSPERAQEAVHDLSRLLRYVLYESSQLLVPLEKELDFIRNYVDLMRIRLPEHVDLTTDITSTEGSTQIAPLLFISLIENAFKHGVSNNHPSYIHIRIKEDKKGVVCEIANSHFPKDAAKDKSGSGIGLVNLEKRLALLYPDKHIFRHGQEEDSYRSLLTITTHTPEK